MKYYKDQKNEVYAYEDDCVDEFIKKGLSSITEEEAMLMTNPPPTPEELILLAQQKKAELIAYASEVIDPMRDAKDGGYIDDEDIPRLAEWQKYRYELTKVDVSTAPDIEWPAIPQDIIRAT
ncbi:MULTISPECIES: tail fiber assembly protein [Yersinia]|uniref:tail fiber assembly protein n=1 Tax=Yersinia TaxID=629 RepID=UPI000C14889D|nr:MULTISPECIES: tail fiber assembly protein [Yersinia]EKN3738780.1 tail fiber assembly protein [Yersinia enterocolitica]MDA5523304.1 tail fiber assembly protein [Yersinia kristensenii]MDA5544578.1 tail fiber assembly protein [Yersinia rochesterensis]PHZ34053.1 phage tail protein [Yersinia kristensenii]UZM76003.1 tail fiber assembly protein [Yersinia sp. SCPM-O-B-9106 (C-191)]